MAMKYGVLSRSRVRLGQLRTRVKVRGRRNESIKVSRTKKRKHEDNEAIFVMQIEKAGVRNCEEIIYDRSVGFAFCSCYYDPALLDFHLQREGGKERAD